MNKAILITRPDHDLINAYFFHWSKKVIEQANKKKVKVLDLAGKKANKKNLTSYIEVNQPKLVFMNGHGNSDIIAGYNDEVLIQVGVNESLLENKIIYVRSCEVGSGLGSSVIKKKAMAFIGYTRKYNLITLVASESRPLDDAIAQLFLAPSNLIPISLLKGNTVGEAYMKSQNSMNRSLRFMLSTKASPPQKDALPYLWANKKHQVLHGDKEARL